MDVVIIRDLLCVDVFSFHTDFEQVENVKAFIGIVCVLLTIRPIFFADVAFSENHPEVVHTNSYVYRNDYYYHVDVPLYAYFYASGCLLHC